MRKDALVTGLALFAMFFGAGNLIFPPYLGMTSGSEWLVGFACFIFVDVVLSCVGIFALNAAGGANAAIEGTLGRVPGLAMNTAAILCTGVLIATPRTAATTYEMAVMPLIGDGMGLAPFSVLFFALVLALTFRQSRVVGIVGKVLTPLLVLGIIVLVAAGVVNPIGDVGAPHSAHVAQDGILAGYQAMDIIACVGFAIVIQDAVRADGYTARRSQLKVMALASCVAAVLLALIYGGLTYLGAMTGLSFGPELNQAQLIVEITKHLMGETGVLVLGVVVGLACLTTAIGLTGATASYFERVTQGRLPYRAGVLIVIGCGLLICNLGLEAIIALATPILSVVCPPFMTTVVLILFLRHIHTTWAYKGAALGALAASVVIVAHDSFGLAPFVTALPLYEFGFSWLPFAAAGGIIGWLAARPAGSSRDLLDAPVEKALEEEGSPIG
ncbi:MAG: branched-chain amino acid transport system II carrier protein [Eggerthellaceae bacterium]|nr:branched-chain amino acid transport system II carrier protein [Eggerthellaceae bacterium]